jgi:hypothetical protein
MEKRKRKPRSATTFVSLKDSATHRNQHHQPQIKDIIENIALCLIFLSSWKMYEYIINRGMFDPFAFIRALFLRHVFIEKDI